MSKRLIVAVVVLSLLLVSISGACSQSPTPTPTSAPVATVTPTPAPQTVKIGYGGAFSGSGSAWSLAGMRGFQMAVQDVNNAGGFLVGSQRYMIAPDIIDAAYNTDGGRAGAERLIFQDNVKMMIMFGTATCLGAQQVTEPNGALLLAMTGSNALIQGNNPNTFRITLALDEAGTEIYSYTLKNFPNNTRMISVASNDPTGKSVMSSFEPLIATLPYKYLGTQYYEPDTTDFYPFISKIMANNPDVMNIISLGANMGPFLKQLYENGYKGLKVMPVGAGGPGDFTVAGAAASEGVLYTRMWDWEGTLVPTIQRDLSRRYLQMSNGEAMIGYTLDVYDGVNALVAGMKASGSTDPAKVRDALAAGTQWPSAYWGTGQMQMKFGRRSATIYPEIIGTVKSGKMVNLAVMNPDGTQQ